MTNDIRLGVRKFYADEHFSAGIERSGFFTISESQFLINYGDTLFRLSNGVLTPKSAMEFEFVACINQGMASQNYAVNLWNKYLNAVHKVKNRVSANSYWTETNTNYENYDEA